MFKLFSMEQYDKITLNFFFVMPNSKLSSFSKTLQAFKFYFSHWCKESAQVRNIPNWPSFTSDLVWHKIFMLTWWLNLIDSTNYEFFFSAGNTIECFECNSWEDPRCHDPFNYTIRQENMPPIRVCEGCCVKMVQFIGTGKTNFREP